MVQTSEKDYLQKLANERGVRVTFESSDNDQQIVERYNRAKVLAIAPIVEPFGLVPLEAMTYDLPVATVREAGLRETFRDGEGGFPVDRDLDKFAAKLAFHLSDDALRQQMGHEGREYVICNWSWDDYIRRLETGISKLIDLAPEGI